MKSGVYQIKQISTGMVYVGSAVNITTRWNHHRCCLKSGDHRNWNLQAAWIASGERDFEFSILEHVADDSLLFAREQAWMDRLHAVFPDGFNILPKAGSHKNRRRSAETKAKMSASMRGKRNGVGNTANLGRKLSEETRRRMSLGRLGNKNAVGNSNNLGTKWSAEARARASRRLKGKPNPRLGEALKRYYATPEGRAAQRAKGLITAAKRAAMKATA
jgi:group I intron endonuclease